MVRLMLHSRVEDRHHDAFVVGRVSFHPTTIVQHHVLRRLVVAFKELLDVIVGKLEVILTELSVLDQVQALMCGSHIEIVLVLKSRHRGNHLLPIAHHTERRLGCADTVVSIPSLTVDTSFIGLLHHAIFWLRQPFRQFPARNAFPHGLRIHVIDRLAGSLSVILLFPLARQTLGEGVLIDIVLIVEFGHREAADALS